MIYFDTLTLYYMLFLINIIMGLFFVVYMKTTNNKQNMNYFILSKFSQGTAWLCFSLYGAVPIWVYTYMSDTFLIAGWLLESMVFVQFKQQLNKKMKLFYGFTFFFILIGIFLDIKTFGYYRKLAFISAYFLYIGLAGLVLIKVKENTRFQRIMGWIYVVNSLITLLTFIVVLRPDNYQQAIDALKTDIFSMTLMTLMQAVGAVGFLLLVNERDQQVLESMAATDGLSGILNRRSFFNQVESVLRTDLKTRELSLVLIDIDHFKLINDQHGHMVGDMVIREFCQTVSKIIRKQDIFARYGGEEFIIFMPEANVEVVQEVNKRIQKAVQNSIDNSEGKLPYYTVSIGFVSKESHCSYPIDELLQMSDSALYHAKNSGRNCLAGLTVGHELEEMKVY